LNALKHGRRAASILLPGEDAAEFNELLEELFEDYRPRTRREMRCVEAIADYEWCLERNGWMRRYYHGKVTALHTGDPAAQPHCEHDPHRWHHSAQDCTREEARLMRLRKAAVEELAALKQLRRQNLLNDAMHAMEGPVARPRFPAAPPASPAAEARPDVTRAAADSAAPSATGAPTPGMKVGACASTDGQNPVFPERAGQAVHRYPMPGAPPVFPWNMSPNGGPAGGAPTQ
jgi:hypothetical protein